MNTLMKLGNTYKAAKYFIAAKYTNILGKLFDYKQEVNIDSEYQQYVEYF